MKLGFKFDNVLMEEAAQILEIETFIPLMCQVCPAKGVDRRHGLAQKVLVFSRSR